MQGDWKQGRETVVGDHEVPDRTAVYVHISVPNATAGCNICIEGPNHVQRLFIEPTSILDGRSATAGVVNTTRGSVKLKQGIFLSKALGNGKQVMPEPAESPQASNASVDQLPSNNERSQDPTPSSYVSVVDYSELKQSLLKIFVRYSEVIELPGEPLGATAYIEHQSN